MTRVLILGAGGMLGHKLYQRTARQFDTWAGVHGSAAAYARYAIFEPGKLITGIDATDADSLAAALARCKPDVVVNCIGVVKQLAAAKDPITSIAINSLLPHRLARLCSLSGARLIHFSTDCVFSGRRGMYCESDSPDAEDLYGRSKLLGEVSSGTSLTLRTSIIGRELTGAHGLVEWFLAAPGDRVGGYTHAVFSGLTTLALADVVADVIANQPDLAGLWHVSADPIAKRDLLQLIGRRSRPHTQIVADDSVRIDRSLNSDRFRSATGFRPAPWSVMVDAMIGDSTPYEEWRAGHAA